jgi:hypothetical protein
MEIQHYAGTYIPSCHRPDSTKIANLIETEMIDIGLLQLESMDTLTGTGLSGEKIIRSVVEMSTGEVEDMLRVLEGFVDHSRIGDFNEQEWIDINRNPDAVGSIERLLALLLTVLRLVARVSTEQTNNAAQMGILTTKLAEQSGTFSVNSAMSNFSGAGTALFATGIMTGMGVMTSIKGVGANIKNMEKNMADVDKLKIQSAQIDNEVASLATSARSQEAHPSKKSELSILQQKARDIESLVSASTTEQQISRLKADRMQMAGGAMTGISYPIGTIGMTAFGVKAASEKADSTISDAQKEVASSLQRNEDQAAQQKAEIVAKILALVAAAQDSNLQTVATVSHRIPA